MKFDNSTIVRRKRSSSRHVCAVGVIALLAGGCGSVAVPNAQFADTTAAVAEAEGTGAQDTPRASLYLKMAKDGLETAKRQMESDQNEQAIETLQRAKADAKLAKTLTTEAKVREEADLAIQLIEDLQAQAPPQI